MDRSALGPSALTGFAASACGTEASRNIVASPTILAAINFRHACKKFDPERIVGDEDFSLILEAARLSPSSFGLEPWQFLVVQNGALREALKPHVWGGQTQLPSTSHLVVILARSGRDMRFDSPHIDHCLREQLRIPPERVDRWRAMLGDFQDKSFHLLESERALSDWALRQCYIALANMMTVAAMRGVDSCPIEGFSADAVAEVLDEHCGVDRKHFVPAVMVAFGYRAGPQPDKRRLPAEQTIRWFR